MKKYFLPTILAVSFSYSGFIYANAVQSATAITDCSKSVLVKKGQDKFTITLASNPSTGFIWLINSYDSHLLKIAKHEYLAPKIKNKVGVAGKEQWVFKVKSKIIAPQLTKIAFVHARPWEVANTTAENKTITIVFA